MRREGGGDRGVRKKVRVGARRLRERGLREERREKLQLYEDVEIVFGCTD